MTSSVIVLDFIDLWRNEIGLNCMSIAQPIRMQLGRVNVKQNFGMKSC